MFIGITALHLPRRLPSSLDYWYLLSASEDKQGGSHARKPMLWSLAPSRRRLLPQPAREGFDLHRGPNSLLWWYQGSFHQLYLKILYDSFFFFIIFFLLWWIETRTASPQLRHFSVFSPVYQIVCGHTRPTPVSALSLWAFSVRVWHSTTRVWLGYNWKMTPNGPKFQPSVSWAMTAGVTGQYSSGSLTLDCQRKSNSTEQKWETCVAIEMNIDGCHQLTAHWPWVKLTFAPERRLPGRARV